MAKSFRLHVVLTTLLLTLACGLQAAGDKRFTLVIDPGHGGKDAGCVGSFSKEKNINLTVALAFGRLVEQNCPDVRVIYTRKIDVFIPLGDRPNIANKAKADLFISIHTNSVENNHTAHGVETYTLCLEKMTTNLEFAKRENSAITLESDYKTRYEGFDPNKAESYVIFEFMQNQHMKQSIELAKCIQKQYVGSGRKDKGVKQANLLVLRNTTMPAVLTELGFITHAEEERFLNSKEGVHTLATAIFNGFMAYRGAPSPLAVTKQDAAISPAKPAGQTPSSTPEAATKEEQPAEPTPAKEPSVEQAREEKVAVPETEYRIQFASSSRQLSTTDARFKGVQDISVYTDGNLYKYTTGHFKTRTEARERLNEVRRLHADAFIVKFRGNERVTE